MAASEKTRKNCFSEFDDVSPRKQEPSVQVLYEYEKHYMELVKKYGPEISRIEEMLEDLRSEQEQFYSKKLPEIISTLKKNGGVDEEIQRKWIERLSNNMERSFSLSETLITDYATKKIDEFKKAVEEKLKEI